MAETLLAQRARARAAEAAQDAAEVIREGGAPGSSPRSSIAHARSLLAEASRHLGTLEERLGEDGA